MELNIERLRELIEKQGVTVSCFARKIGITPSTMSKILNGKSGAGRETIGKILAAFPNESISSLFFLSSLLPNGIKKKAK